jgi:hypothetical protein
MFTLPPALCPYWASKDAVSTLSSCTASDGGMNAIRPRSSGPPKPAVSGAPSSVNSLAPAPPSIRTLEGGLLSKGRANWNPPA